ncbi:testis-expressed protein 26-like isoform X2 [Micropterus dolomieu]|uniref:testis-expressed protein 26-like isoform X2 n=1 Tax=Micropterus dolomieu TaxID=147949 RepID=UPI001E8ED7D7|nr:testis-expressed protein 26-like isoform X2 [Micropterus dolomieu]
MATKECKQSWDPYETSHGRHFVYRPNLDADIQLCPKSTSFIDSYSQSGPFGSTVYNKDFCWKPVCKPECLRTGTASGQRRNNPHPSQSFMMWRLPRDAAQSSVSFSWKCPPSEGEMRKALTAQYRSTYRCDFMERRLVPVHSRHEVPLPFDTAMRDNYHQPKQKPELLCNNTDPNVACCGIVPTVVQRHVHTQQKRSDLTNYDRFCGKNVPNAACVIKSLLPPELQQLHRILPEEERAAVKTILSKDAYPNNREKVNKLPAILNSCSPEWISSWPGPP